MTVMSLYKPSKQESEWLRKEVGSFLGQKEKKVTGKETDCGSFGRPAVDVIFFLRPARDAGRGKLSQGWWVEEPESPCLFLSRLVQCNAPPNLTIKSRREAFFASPIFPFLLPVAPDMCSPFDCSRYGGSVLSTAQSGQLEATCAPTSASPAPWRFFLTRNVYSR